jgi:hypothetical protein
MTGTRMYVLRRKKDGKYWAPSGPGLYSGRLCVARIYPTKKAVPLALVDSAKMEIVRVRVTIELEARR